MKASSAAAPAPCAFCGELQRHRVLCPEWPAWHAEDRAKVEQVVEVLETRATGRRTLRSAAVALKWYALTRSAWMSPKALPIDPDREGTGSPNRGLDDPKRQTFAKVAFAIKKAEQDDRERHPTCPAPLFRWLMQHFGAGRGYAQIAESEGWPEADVSARLERALRVVRVRLREREVLE